MYGWHHKLLRIDLTHQKTMIEDIDPKISKNYIGGRGVAIKYLYDEVDPKKDWSDPENRLVIASGPLGGTVFGGSGTFSVVTKGALTNGATSVQANGLFGAYIKFSGYDGVIIQGMGERWFYLFFI